MTPYRKTLPCLLCLCAATTPLHAVIIGSDDDEMSDVWEDFYGFATYDNGTLYPDQAPSADPDGDGKTNLQEARAGTNPWNREAPIGFLQHVITNAGPDFTVSWFGMPGKRYDLLYSLDLDGTWDALGDPYLGDDQLIEYMNNVSGPKTFFRLEVSDLDQNNDEITDFEAHLLGIDPEEADSDSDGMPDKWELDHFGTLAANPGDDPDGDGVINLNESLAHSNPLDMDSDGDGVPDDEDPDHEALAGDEVDASSLMVISPLK